MKVSEGKAYRRAQIDRLKKKRRAYYQYYPTTSGRVLGIIVHTPALCSCVMCGNPRKYFNEKTHQEEQQRECFEYDKLELYSK